MVEAEDANQRQVAVMVGKTNHFASNLYKHSNNKDQMESDTLLDPKMVLAGTEDPSHPTNRKHSNWQALKISGFGCNTN